MLNELDPNKIITNGEGELSNLIGENKHLLRKLAMIHQTKKYKDNDYIQKVKKLCITNDWGIKIVDDKI